MSTTVKLSSVRLSFPVFWEAKDFEGDGKFQYQGTFLFPKLGADGQPSPQATSMLAAIKEACAKKYGEKGEAKFLAYKAAGKIWAVQDGDLKAAGDEMYDAYAGNWYTRAKNKVRPTVVDRNPNKPLNQADGRPYSGCYVNAVIEVYAYDTAGGGVSCSLLGVQFEKDGDAFGGSTPVKPDVFADLGVPEGGASTEGSLF